MDENQWNTSLDHFVPYVGEPPIYKLFGCEQKAARVSTFD